MGFFPKRKTFKPRTETTSELDYSLLTFGNDHVTRSQLTPAYIRKVRAKALSGARESLKRDLST